MWYVAQCAVANVIILTATAKSAWGRFFLREVARLLESLARGHKTTTYVFLISQFCETLVGPKLWQSGSGFRGPIWDLLLGAVFETSCPRSAFQTLEPARVREAGTEKWSISPEVNEKKNTLFQHVWPAADTVLCLPFNPTKNHWNQNQNPLKWG